MSYLVPREGAVQLLSDVLAGGTLEDWHLGLYKTSITPAETDAAATYTAQEADFVGYARKTLTRTVGSSTWNTPAAQTPSGSPAWSARTQVGHSQYGSAPQVFTCSGTGGAVYGYFVVGKISGKLIMAEKFATSRTLASGDTLSMTPVFEAA